MFKLYSIVRASNSEVLESFNTLESAEKFLIMMKSKGEDVILKTNEDDVEEDPTTYDIEGLDIIEPKNDFGTDLDQFNEPGALDTGMLDVDSEDL